MSTASDNARLSSVDLIRAKQKRLKEGQPEPDALRDMVRTLEHNPDALIFGCIDARIPLAQLGMQHGKALAARMPGAYVNARLLQNGSEGSSIEVALKRGVTDIIVMGHTDCAAMGCCLNGRSHPDNAGMERTLDFLAPLEGERQYILDLKLTEREARRAMEEAAVCASLDNIEHDPALRKAIDSNKVRLHGWIIDLPKALGIEKDSSGRLLPFLSEVVDRKAKTFMLMADVLHTARP